ncbi:hypothetical protein IAQ61_004028 [Plenodomus lingam]|uniref:uncharacterized protein n=1 Tax=Leptosphaeria maculans TaxID=5022 RepID=UPI00331BBB47|nr:hypothetical protein IAQ61_004028 [Plenodomus lingam]
MITILQKRTVAAHPLCPSKTWDLGLTSSSPPPLFPFVKSSPSNRATRPCVKHTHSASDPTNNSSPPEPSQRQRHPTSAPVASPTAGTTGSAFESFLGRIAESPYERDRAAPPRHIEKVQQKGHRMEPTRLQLPTGGTKARAIQQAKEMEALVAERAKRGGEEPPPYDFFELIGKGAYGRVFKGKSRVTGSLVAIKIIEIDKVDYEEMTTKNLQDTLKEIDILQQLRDSKARPYVNIIEEARPVHNELWIVSEYASGGSVNTLMKPTSMLKDPGPGLPEKFIIPIARELATGLKYIHEAGVLHRDLKSNNVLILEDGRVQLCDFGVSNTLEPEKSKRSTIVGTPYWMAPELQREWVKDADPKSRQQPKEISYGNEVDIWAYGCTIYEMATGFPPHHKTVQWDLPTAGAPQLEGDRFSKELKDFLAFILQPEPQDRPTPDQILGHPYLIDSTKMYPTVSLVKLVEEYYIWEHQGGARQSLFNPYGAQAPDPLAPEPEDDEDDDWSFSTTDEFEHEHAPQFNDPFAGGSGQTFNGMNIPPAADMGRFEQLQARFKEEAIVRGQQRLNKLFDTSTTPYRYSAIDTPESSNGRPPSDLALREFNPGAPNRETVIDLDFSLPSVDDVPSIDLGEVPTIRANRMKSLIREMEEEEQQEKLDTFNTDDELTARRATKDWSFPPKEDNRKTMEWSFPSVSDNRKTMEWSFPAADPAADANRKTMEWTFPAQPQKPNRRTVEWTFDAAMAEANNEMPRRQSNRMSRRRETKEWTFPKQSDNRKTQDFAFPMSSPERTKRGGHSKEDPDPSISPTLGPGFRPTLRHAQTAPLLDPIDDYPEIISAPSSPLRGSIIDLDMAMVETYRPSTSGSDAIHTAGTERMNENPFNLEDQVQLSENNHRASFHMKSQSEPNHAVPGLLTPQQYDDQGAPVANDGRSLHARGVSSASQVRDRDRDRTSSSTTMKLTGQKDMPGSSSTSISTGPSHRSAQRSQQMIWDGWSHTTAFGLSSDDQSPPMSVSTDASLEEEDVDELWDVFERNTLHPQRRWNSYAPLRSARSTVSTSTFGGSGLDSDTDVDDADGQGGYNPYSSDSAYEDPPPLRLPQTSVRKSTVSVGPGGKPVVEFPIPRGPDVEKLLAGGVAGMGIAGLAEGAGAGIGAPGLDKMMADMLLKSALELRDGTRAGRDLLRAMKLEEVDDELSSRTNAGPGAGGGTAGGTGSEAGRGGSFSEPGDSEGLSDMSTVRMRAR